MNTCRNLSLMLVARLLNSSSCAIDQVRILVVELIIVQGNASAGFHKPLFSYWLSYLAGISTWMRLLPGERNRALLGRNDSPYL